jgi:hypothetical protein
MQKKRKRKRSTALKNKSNKALTGSPRVCPWVVITKAGLTAFRSLYGVARLYKGNSDMWCDVQPGELRFHFAAYDSAFPFVAYCLKRKFETTFRDDRKLGVLQNLDAFRNLPRPQKDKFLMVQTTPEMRTYPTRIELAGYYSEDAADFFRRYHMTYYSEETDFRGVKSRLAKTYVDLRMALEALLKATICLRGPYALAGKPLVDRIRGYSHNIDRLTADALKGVRVDQRYITAISKCSIAPVDLRYQFDAMNFRVPDDRNYYDTIGSSVWIKTIEEFVETGARRLRTALGRRSRIVPGSVAIQELRNRPSDYPRVK